MDPLLAILEGHMTPEPEPEPEQEPAPAHTFMEPAEISLITLNYYDNKAERELWMSANNAITFQFFDLTGKPFTPHHTLSRHNCTAQLHDPDFMYNYVESYRSEYDGSKSVATVEELKWLSDLVNQSQGMKLGLLYEKIHGTTYHWGNVVRTRTNKLGSIVADLYLGCELFRSIPLDEPNLDKNPKTANIPFRGRFDPNKLWKIKRNKKAAS